MINKVLNIIREIENAGVLNLLNRFLPRLPESHGHKAVAKRLYKYIGGADTLRGKAPGCHGRKLVDALQLALLGAFLFPANVLAVNLDSTNFTIFDNSINSGGGRTTSTNFILESTIGEFSGNTTSTNFSSRAGFQAIEAEPKLTMALSANSVSLGNITTGAVSSGSLSVVVTTNARSGYSVKITEDNNLHSGSNDISDVSDGAVSVGHEEYGISTSGSAGQFNSTDTAISGTVTVASNSSFASAESTTVNFKAAIDSATFNGSYGHTVTFTAVANF